MHDSLYFITICWNFRVNFREKMNKDKNSTGKTDFIRVLVNFITRIFPRSNSFFFRPN